MSQEAELTLLVECHDALEVASVKSLLSGHDIPFVVQGEQHASMVGGLMGNPAIVPRVLVAKRDFMRASTLLNAEPDLSNLDAKAALESGVCAVHEQPAIGTCARCGGFVCGACEVLGEPPVCSECLKLEQTPPRSGLGGKIFLGVILLAFAVMLLVRYL